MANLNSVKLILPENPSPSVLFAADELDSVFALCRLKKPERAASPAAGEKFISLGDTAVKKKYGFEAAKSIGGGYCIRTLDGNYFIYSYEPSGVINGVYGFLERAVAVSYTHLDVYKRQALRWLRPLRTALPLMPRRVTANTLSADFYIRL